MSSRKSGVNLHLEAIGETYDGTHCGTRGVGLAQVSLSNDNVDIWQVLIQADFNNAQGSYVYVGNEAHGCFVALSPGQSVTVPINSLSKVFVRGSVVGLNVNWIAMI